MRQSDGGPSPVVLEVQMAQVVLEQQSLLFHFAPVAKTENHTTLEKVINGSYTVWSNGYHPLTLQLNSSWV